jgi:uncharacterized protein YjiS (DUF1127 family)
MVVTLSNIRSASAGEWDRWLSICMSRVMTWCARREAIKMLRQLDDHQLRDIGLPRHQIESLMRRRYSSDSDVPFSFLAASQKERQAR